MVPGAVRTRRISHQRLGAVLALFAVIATLVAGYLIAASQNGRQALIAERFATRHTTAIRFIEAYVAQIQAHQHELGATALQGPVTAAQFDAIARQNLFASAVLLDQQGQVLASSPPEKAQVGVPLGMTYAYLRLALAGIPTVSDVVTSTSSRLSVVDFAVPFGSGPGRRVLSTGYAISDTPLQPFVVSALGTYRSAEVYLVDSGGTVITSNRPQTAGRLMDRTSPELSRAMSRQGTGFLGDDRHRRYFINGPVKGTGWRLVYALDTTELYSTVSSAQTWVPWAALGGFLVMSLAMIRLFIRALVGRSRAEGEHARQEAILDTAGDAFIGMDADGRITDWNLAATRLLGWTRAEALDQVVADLIVPPADRNSHSTGLRNFIDTEVPQLPSQPITVTAQHRDGHSIPVELTVSRSQWLGIWRFHGFMRDITERLLRDQQLTDLALTDSLTGLANRRAFLDRLDQAHSRSRRHGSSLAVLYADVDQFKAINDSYGHAAGDAILCEVAVRMRAMFRTEDTIGRLGGDEFAVVCEDFNGSPGDLSTRVGLALAEPYSFRGQPILATVSVGIAIPDHSDTSEHLLERADGSMYAAKSAQRR
jgi:diguanylate cyclase (GGDEF)-like protein/PAS domain S-box-containing protein